MATMNLLMLRNKQDRFAEDKETRKEMRLAQSTNGL